ncbi:transcriptional regulator GutM [soil metagenome]
MSSLLLVVGLLWLSQIVGTYFQMEHYRKVLGGIRQSGSEGFVGVGNAKVRLGKGVILILVVGENGVVTEALRMRGMTVFARFKEAPDLLGKKLDELRDEDIEGLYEQGTMLAVRRAVEQIDRIRQEKAEAAIG